MCKTGYIFKNELDMLLPQIKKANLLPYLKEILTQTQNYSWKFKRQ